MYKVVKSSPYSMEREVRFVYIAIYIGFNTQTSKRNTRDSWGMIGLGKTRRAPARRRLNSRPRQSRHCESEFLEQLSPLSCDKAKASVFHLRLSERYTYWW